MQGFKPLKGKKVLLGISGGIAAFKVAGWVRRIRELVASVQVVMTSNGAKFVSPLTFAALSGQNVHLDTFDETDSHLIPHISLAREADLFLVAPATANIIAKAACGLADDLLSTLILAYSGPILFAPSMNPSMYNNVATQDNIQRLRARGHVVLSPSLGATACGETGPGRLPEWYEVRIHLLKATCPPSLRGKRVMVTAGPTREFLDPVRYLSNRSSGKMGYAIAEAAVVRGAKVVLISGPTSLPPVPGARHISVISAQEMLKAVEQEAGRSDVMVMAAAVSDYRPANVSGKKIKKGANSLSVGLEKTTDILSTLSRNRKIGQIVVGFCAETHDLEQNAIEKLKRKGTDLMVANDVTQEGAGFDWDTNQVTLFYRDGRTERLEMMPKSLLAHQLWDRIEGLIHD